MKKLSGAGVFRELERLIDPGTVAGLTESELVARFVDRRDPIAFEAIVSRHGPMVLSVCRVMLADANDVDDAFQATFAILIEKARRLRRPERLGPWLHGVAYRVAHRARTRRREWSIPEDLAGRSSDDVLEKRKQLAALHDEIERLPEKYRLPVVLCCLEERSGEEAARRLGWPIGTVNGRLSHAPGPASRSPEPAPESRSLETNRGVAFARRRTSHRARRSAAGHPRPAGGNRSASSTNSYCRSSLSHDFREDQDTRGSRRRRAQRGLDGVLHGGVPAAGCEARRASGADLGAIRQGERGAGNH